MAQDTAELIRQAREALKSPHRQAQERRGALLESGRDPFAEQLQSMIPINQAVAAATQDGRVAGLAKLSQAAVIGRGGADAAPWLTRLAKRIARRPDQVDDLVQAANEAVLKEGGTLNPRGAMRAAKSAMLNAQAAGGSGTRSQTAAAIAKAENRIGERAGELRLWAETNKNLAKPITLERFRTARGQRRQPTTSLDVEVGEGVTLADTLRGTESPEARAIMREGVQRLTSQQQTNMLKKLQGENVNPAILQRIQQKLRGGKDTPPPISGGSGSMQNPGHADFLALQQSDPRVSRALDRSPVGQGFSSIPEAQWSPGQMGVTAPRGGGAEESGVPLLESLMGGPAGARILQGINPGIPVPGLKRQTRLHEGLHALIMGKQSAAGQPMTGTVDPRHALKIAFHMAQRGHRPFEAISEDYPHRAVDAMAWNIRRRNP